MRTVLSKFGPTKRSDILRKNPNIYNPFQHVFSIQILQPQRETIFPACRHKPRVRRVTHSSKMKDWVVLETIVLAVIHVGTMCMKILSV